MKQRTRHSGFALLLAIGMMMIVAVAMLMLASAASYDGHRTFRQMRDAQVGQMLQAGAISATARLAGVPPQTGDSWLVEVPFELQSRGAWVRTTVASGESDSVEFVVIAKLDDRSGEQRVRFEKDQGSWRLISAELNP